MIEKDNCPACGALPCDWVDDPHVQQNMPFLFPAVAAIDAERRRQITEEGWTAEHDDRHAFGELAAAASAYALKASLPPQDHRFGLRMPPPYWPFSDQWWKPKNRRHDLVRAAALIVAEIERMDRLAVLATS